MNALSPFRPCVMILSFAIIMVLNVASALAGRSKGTDNRICGTYISKEELVRVETHFQANKKIPPKVSGLACSSLNVYWHIIARDETLSGGYIPGSQASDAISVLNDAYTSMGIRFNLLEIDRTIDASWFRVSGTNSSGQHAMKQALRKGTVADLNIYTVGSIGGSGGARLLGYSTFPYEYEARPHNDGVVVLYNTLPGGSHEPFNLGHILTHETGHWAGLYHTFQGECSEPGDYISDTPAEAGPATGCLIGRDTCPGGGPDPVQNFMDYSDDACMTEFTAGQGERAREQLATYRNIHF